MIVKDINLSREKSHEIAVKMLKLYAEESEKFIDGGDPAEQIYLAAHVMGHLCAKFSISMDGYNKIYNIPEFDGKVFRAWVANIELEILDANPTMADEIYNTLIEEQKNAQ